MAIEKTAFTGTTQAANALEVYAFLNTNGGEYFDDVVLDETTNKRITCYVGETTALVLNFDGTNKSVIIKAANNSALSSNSASLVWGHGIKTSKGLALHVSGFDVIISKNNNGNPIIVYHGNAGSSSAITQICTSDILDGYARSLISNTSGVFYSTGVTTFTQLPLSATDETYTPDVYLAGFSQYLGTVGKLMANGKEYYYTGYIALGG